MPWYFSIRWKLALSYIALIAVLLIAFLFIALNSIETYYMDDRVEEVQFAAVMMADYVVGRHSFERLEQAPAQRFLLQDTVWRRGEAYGIRILVLNDNARVIADSHGGSRVGQTIIMAEIVDALNGNSAVTLQRDRYVLNVSESIYDIASGRTGAVLFVASVDDIFESLADIRTMLMLTTLLVGLLSVVVVFVISHYLISPLKRTVNVVRRMTTGQLALRIPVKGNDEYAILAQAFNGMTEKLEQVEKSREEFVSNVSHEMKTPLSAIKVLSESILLQGSAPEEMYREFLQDITSEVNRMTNITNDLLALVKVDQREQGLNIRSLELSQLVEDILKRLAPLAEQKKIGLYYEVERPVQFDADEIKLSLAISNIVENGIKYTPKGGTVRVSVDSDHQNASVTIQDSGIGIPEEEQDKIFARFYRVDKARDRETGGTGLGLAISRAAVLLHGGSIRVSSKADEGSTFVIKLPLRR